ncbi:tetratricopeptide repeat protein [Botrimarina sp.]|uniref:tetratricopeptide repeat protein n=1 Tax=Botrimarina sp. TaxID=2795802 RepID=UPI0032EB0538
MQRPILLALTATLAVAACRSDSSAVEFPSLAGLFGGGEQQPRKGGGRDWWRRHKSKAEFVPGEGYRVPGYEGFYDGSGVPIDAPIDQQAIRLSRVEAPSGGLLPGLDPKKAAERVREAAGYGPDEAVARRLLEEGVALFQEGKRSAAADRFDDAAARWPGTDVAAKAMFNRAEALYFDNNFKDAADAYVELLDKHPSTPKLDAAVERMWTIAQFWERTHFTDSWRPPFDYQPLTDKRPTFDTIGHSLRLYEAIRLNDPTGPRADDAIMATAGVHFRRHQYVDADYHYRLLREEYPRSEHQFEAHLLGLQSLLQKYHGPDYDGSPLEEAKKLEEQTRLNFAGRLSDEDRQRLTEVRAQIAAAVEERGLRMADYYEGAGHVGAARYYLTQLQRKHAGSPVAERAAERLAALEGQPAEPDVPLEWLVNLLPENKKFESINSIQELEAGAPEPTTAPPGGGTLVADESAGDDTQTR